ncbi:hypothetical protein HAZT_HAZT008214 [Hyalella azteca]|uniref:RBR-type E3 ubiquitin transferase n=1 Tax=Hyalella azteca TaxID=294128 RepID=A0A6A0HA55_HYAAZ|nr:hypothetical protein HAZT_HAZT008214 [Hyalella azteca]
MAAVGPLISNRRDTGSSIQNPISVPSSSIAQYCFNGSQERVSSPPAGTSLESPNRSQKADKVASTSPSLHKLLFKFQQYHYSEVPKSDSAFSEDIYAYSPILRGYSPDSPVSPPKLKSSVTQDSAFLPRSLSRASSIAPSLASAGASYLGSFIGSLGSGEDDTIYCRLCLMDVSVNLMCQLSFCQCRFCRFCMAEYVRVQILSGQHRIECPDGSCDARRDGVGELTSDEIEALVGNDLLAVRNKLKLDAEVTADPFRVFCPRPGCATVIRLKQPKFAIEAKHSIDPDLSAALAGLQSPAEYRPFAALQMPLESSSDFRVLQGIPEQPDIEGVMSGHGVTCPTCQLSFCPSCGLEPHGDAACASSLRASSSKGIKRQYNKLMGVDSSDLPGVIKCCPNPKCRVPIERNEGCAQMQCRACKHTFCWYCLASLEEDFLLRHYDKGPCRNKLGHSRASVLCHRLQVIAIFVSVGLLVFAAAPLLVFVGPCVLCCRSKNKEAAPNSSEDC